MPYIRSTMDVNEAILRRLQEEASRIIYRAIARDESAIFLGMRYWMSDHLTHPHDSALCCRPPWYSINDELEAEAARENSEADYPEAYATVDGMTIEEFSQWRQGNAKLS